MISRSLRLSPFCCSAPGQQPADRRHRQHRDGHDHADRRGYKHDGDDRVHQCRGVVIGNSFGSCGKCTPQWSSNRARSSSALRYQVYGRDYQAGVPYNAPPLWQKAPEETP
jgi:hypothetical protein